jgi:cytochrome oxidase Cu insertion factor (SCO1/SenC/PrrC family)
LSRAIEPRAALGPALALAAALALVGPAVAHEDGAPPGDAPGRERAAPPGSPVFLYEPPAPGTYDLPPIRRAPDLTAADALSGRTVRLAELRGRAVLLTFIYTACPDPEMCPLTIATTRRVRDILRERGLAGRVRFVAVTIDPERDTPEALRRYAGLARADGPEWLFLRPGSEAAAAPILAAYDLHPRRTPDGTIAHLLRTYLVDPEGVVRQIYLPSYFDVRVVANDITTVLMRDGAASVATGRADGP